MTQYPVIVCPDCAEAPCVAICPTRAIVTTESHTTLILTELCIGCGSCLTECPFDRLEMDYLTLTVRRSPL